MVMNVFEFHSWCCGSKLKESNNIRFRVSTASGAFDVTAAAAAASDRTGVCVCVSILYLYP